jgi:hypothetical protein
MGAHRVHVLLSSHILISTICSRPPTRLENLLQVLPTLLVCRLVILQLLLEVGDLSGGLAALTRKTLVNCVDGNIDEPGTGQ